MHSFRDCGNLLCSDHTFDHERCAYASDAIDRHGFSIDFYKLYHTNNFFTDAAGIGSFDPLHLFSHFNGSNTRVPSTGGRCKVSNGLLTRGWCVAESAAPLFLLITHAGPRDKHGALEFKPDVGIAGSTQFEAARKSLPIIADGSVCFAPGTPLVHYSPIGAMMGDGSHYTALICDDIDGLWRKYDPYRHPWADLCGDDGASDPRGGPRALDTLMRKRIIAIMYERKP